MDQTRRNQIAAMQDTQRQRAATYKPSVPEIPMAQGCAGGCTQAPPPPPVSNTAESFRDGSAGLPREWWIMIGSISFVYYLVCLRRAA